MFGADENARDGHDGPRQAIETCGIVEEMLSDELLLAITGDPVWAERCENATFNSLPAAFTPDFKGLRYLVAPNQPQSDHISKAPGIANGDDMFGMNPWGHRCCQHNSGHGWPYFCEHLWYATAGDGLAAYLYAPCTVTARVAGGVGAEDRRAARLESHHEAASADVLGERAHRPSQHPPRRSQLSGGDPGEAAAQRLGGESHIPLRRLEHGDRGGPDPRVEVVGERVRPQEHCASAGPPGPSGRPAAAGAPGPGLLEGHRREQR